MIDDNGNIIPEVEKYPELKKLYLERRNKQQELQQILYAHPEMWKPIEDDASMYYDYDDICKKIEVIQKEGAEYIQEIEEKLEPFMNKFGTLDTGAVFRDKNAKLDVALDDETASLMNEYFYLIYLYFDALATVGDKQDKVLWDAVPQVIKDKYVQFVNDKMVQMLASDDRLVECIKNFDVNETNPDAHERFIRLLEKKLNDEFFGKVGRPVSINLFLNKQNMGVGGTFNMRTGEISLNTAYWGGLQKPSVDEVVGTIKHEVLGHYANSNLSTLGLYGGRMKDFMCEIQKYTHSQMVAAIDVCVTEAVSPLLKQHYVIDAPTNNLLQDLQKNGWDCGIAMLNDDYRLYQNTFEERSAWLITPTHDIIGQIDRYRASHGLPQITKSK